MRTAKALSAILVAGLFLSSCASVNFRPLSTGETRLTRMEMPDVVREDLPYEVILYVESEEKLQVSKICFRWVSEEMSTGSPLLYRYSNWSDLSKGPSGGSTGSDMFCTGPESIRTDIAGKLIVKILPVNLRVDYNKLEGQAEYVSDGRMRQTNKISTHVIVER